MDLFQLETFRCVAEERSFSRAAKKLFRSQPAVSQTVRKLEDELGEHLVDRSSRDGRLTDAGQLLLEYAQKLLNTRQEAQGALEELRRMHKGRLGVAANEVTCLYLLPLLDEYRRLHPMVNITVQRSLASHIPDELLSHGVELGLLTYRPDDPLLKSIVVYRDELAFVVPRNHPLATAREVGIQELGAECFIAHIVPSPYRARVLEAFKRRRVPLNKNVELPTIEAIKRFVAEGNGVALLPGICVAAEVARGELVRVAVPELAFERKLRIVHRRGGSLSHAARAFLSIAEHFARHVGKPYLYQAER